METRIFVKTKNGKLYLREVIITEVNELTGLELNDEIKIKLKSPDWVIKLSSRYCELGYFPHLLIDELDSGLVTGYPLEVPTSIDPVDKVIPYQIVFEKYYNTKDYKLDSLDDLIKSHSLFKSTLDSDKELIRKLIIQS